jgi:hypothetical protein
METLAKGKLKAEMAIASIESTYNPELEDFVKDKLESLKRS